MAFWSRIGSADRRVYTRALGLNELGFYYDGHINGTADTLMHTVIHVSPDAPSFIAPDNIARAWVSLKAQFPLLGATVQLHNSVPQLIVAEDRLKGCVPGEIIFSSVSSAEEGEAAAVTIINGERKLSDELLSRILVLSRTDDASTYHVLINIAHLITDGIGNISLLKEFLTVLATPYPDGHAVPDIEARLSLAVAAESLVPTLKMSIARQRWRRAAGHIISRLQDAKRTGGHTLPERSYGPIATRLPARSGFLRTHFSPADTSIFLKKCRQHGFTVGNALPVLGQIALSRMLCRRYIRGDISPEEWEFRKKQPYHTAGPLNLRPFLDKTWYQAGGQNNVSLSVGFFYFTLPFTPLGPPNLAPGDALPELSQLMSPQRFLLRCNIMKRSASRYINHPLFFEIGAARLSAKIPRQKDVAAKWEAEYVSQSEIEKHNVSPMEQAKYGTVMSHGWSTFGNMENNTLPQEYPSHRGAPSTPPLLRLAQFQTFLHCRTGELYLGSGTSRGQMFISVFFDRNVSPDDLIQEWVNEIRHALYLYLGDAKAIGSKL
ncbi:hypothetical protein C8R44DRAFT_986433 [Mycena epipterygia]|nr:hypothetical protein C8R44DRAFT_986433 [Mycena epipterygia]